MVERMIFHAGSPQTIPSLAPRSSQANQTCTPGAVPEKSRILVVDDVEDAAKMLGILLRLDGYQVSIANDGTEALRLASELLPACVLLDIGLPGMNGFEVARRLRLLKGCEDVVIIGVTGYSQRSDQCRSSEAGFDYHLVKPVVYAVVRSLISRASKGLRETG